MLGSLHTTTAFHKEAEEFELSGGEFDGLAPDVHFVAVGVEHNLADLKASDLLLD
jgi:hypothetical protein